MKTATGLVCAAILGALLGGCAATRAGRGVDSNLSWRLSPDEVTTLLRSLFSDARQNPAFDVLCQSDNGGTTFDVQFHSSCKEVEVSFDLVMSLAMNFVAPGCGLARSSREVGDVWSGNEGNDRPLIVIKAECSSDVGLTRETFNHEWVLFVFPPRSNAVVVSSRSTLFKSRGSLSG